MQPIGASYTRLNQNLIYSSEFENKIIHKINEKPEKIVKNKNYIFHFLNFFGWIGVRHYTLFLFY